MDRFGVSEAQILNGVMDDNYKDLIKFEIQRVRAPVSRPLVLCCTVPRCAPPRPHPCGLPHLQARDYYRRANDGIAMLAPASRLSVQAAADIYSMILDKLEANDYDNFRHRAFVPKTEKFLTLPKSWAKVNAMPQE